MSKVTSPKTPVCIVYGAESFYLDATISEARSWSGREVRFFDVDKTPLTDFDVLDQMRTHNYSDGLVTIILDNADLVTESKEKFLRKFLEERAPNDLSVVLVAVIREPKLSALWEAVGLKFKPTNYPKLKAYGEGKSNEVMKYIRETAVRFGLSLDPDMDLALFRATGGDLYTIHNEFKKLAVLASDTGNQKVTREVLTRVVANNTVAEPWAVAEAAFAKNPKEAMRLLSYMYEDDATSASIRICAALIRELQSTLVARSLVDSGMSAEEIATSIEMNPWRCKEHFLPRVKKHSQKALIGHMTKLSKLDVDVKGPARSKRTLVELAVLSVAGV